MNTINKQQLLKQLTKANSTLVKAVKSVGDDRFDMPPAHGKWSTGGILEHLYLVESSVNKMLPMEAGNATRPADQKHGLIDTVFKNDEEYYNSPSLYEPAQSLHNKKQLLEQLMQERSKLAVHVNQLELKGTSEAFRHPGFGSFTRMEWVLFVIHHSNRHARQIQRIAGKVSSS